MKVTLDCLVCFIRQAYRSAKIATSDPEIQRQILISVGAELQNMDMSLSPAELSQFIYEITAKLSGKSDPYLEEKRQQNELAMSVEEELRGIRDHSENPLLTALLLSAAGNIIDLGILKTEDIDIHTAIEQALTLHFAVNHFEQFQKDLRTAKQLLFFLDNAGEIVFDKILIEELQKYVEVTAVVKGTPIINDACMEDAITVGLDKVCNVIPMERGWIGAPWRQLSSDLRKRMEEADIIIGKGQGNYETLDDYPGNVYLLLKAKCSVVAEHMGVKEGEIGFLSPRKQRANHH
ncbi:MAG TPA: ARMT1-like domain-containing protein [Candidatus Hydrogenedens sp.]|nr:ARMT1-like domain-containing protein [Candidatus Hydrogenedens sp.]HOK09822.1 ARMT1-like domain-containing protein [Candidatus Hydrogenedens sp.]HOL19479.1 ARMT1-like domain-containing protein [Candidatus Hydrogenedens sp.]HPP59417.1 ARMT1-like domain-containing protein [Candidatus Hydrogenedens sp.]